MLQLVDSPAHPMDRFKPSSGPETLIHGLGAVQDYASNDLASVGQETKFCQVVP
jgi:hypothetical protein